jgi:hypothetical protein
LPVSPRCEAIDLEREIDMPQAMLIRTLLGIVASGGRPANVAMRYSGADFLTVSDTNTGPVLAYEVPPLATLSGSVR